MNTRAHSDHGTALIEFVWLAIVLLVPMVYILIAVFDLQRAAYGVSAASKSAARAFLLAPDEASARHRAEEAASLALEDQNVRAGAVSIVCTPSQSLCLTPGSSVRVVVRVTQKLPLTPTFLGDQIAAITVDSTHVEPYSRYRMARQ